jgi:hypothetical protein
MLENKILERMCGPKKEEVTGGWRKLQNYTMSSFTIYTVYQILLRKLNEGGSDEPGKQRAWRKGDVHTGIWSENLKENYHS